MSTIAGIDFSSRAVDICLLDEDDVGAEYHRFGLVEIGREADAFERTRSIRIAMPARGWWEDHGVIAIGIEQPRGRYGTQALFRVQGGILQCLPADLLVQPWNPAEWRKACGLPGNAPKEAVGDWVDELHGHRLGWHSDAYDAYAIAYATRSVLERSEAA